MAGDITRLDDGEAGAACDERVGRTALGGSIDAAIASDPHMGAGGIARIAYGMHVGVHVVADIGLVVVARIFLQRLIEVAAELAVGRRARDGQLE
jgi:hypothetical protein